jgi:RNA recognition motif-containing protein
MLMMKSISPLVSGMPKQATEEDLTDSVSQAGDVARIKIVVDHFTGYFRGSSFCKFYDQQSVQQTPWTA